MQNNYPIAPHSYFSISNYEVAKKAFLSDHIENPIFEYPKRFNAKTVAKRITLSNSNPSAVRELNLVRLAIAMQKDSGLVDKFRAANLDLYGEPKRFFYGAALNYYLRHLDSKSTDVNNQILAKLFGNFLSNPRPCLSAPSPKVFRLYRKYANEYFQSLTPSSSLLEAMEKTFQLSHLQDKSWQLVQKSNIKTAKVSRRSRSIFYNPNYVVRSHRNGFNSIAVHEIFGHAFRYSSSHLQYSQGESEGWALFLEQVCAKKFHYRRAYRYIAAALAWGKFGGAKDFRNTFEALWRLMSLSGRYNVESARSYAFDETARVFRGGRPDLPGAVFLKDTIYLRGNLEVWRCLKANLLTYEEFKDILEGRRNIL